MEKEKHIMIRVISFILVLTIGILSVAVFSKPLTDPHTYASTIKSIDEKKATVLGVSAAIAGSATVLAAVPEDATTPLANEMMDLSSYLVAVVCILVLEKSLLTVFGALFSYVLLPLACILVLIYIVKRKAIFSSWAIKVAVFGTVLLLLVPGAMKLSDYIYEVNHITIEQKVEESISTESAEEETAENENLPWYNKLWNNITESVQQTAEAAIAKGKEALNQFIDAVSLFVIAYCAVPIVILWLFLWVIKFLFGIDISTNGLWLKPKKGISTKNQTSEELATSKI